MIKVFLKKIKYVGTGETDQCLREMAALAEGLIQFSAPT